ncbi:MAG TPA: hypothetical protein PKL83_01665 [bacterium]|nr:hypothetical protein [bacterium]
MDIRMYLKVLYRHRIIVLFIMVTTLAAAAYWITRKPVTYSANLSVIVNYHEDDAERTGEYFGYNNYYGNLIAQSFNESMAGLLKNSGLVESVFTRAGIADDYAQLASPSKYFKPIPKSRHVTEIRFSDTNQDNLNILAAALIEVLDEKAISFVETEAEGKLSLGIEGPVFQENTPPIAIYLAIIAIIALGIGFGCAFFVYYLRDEIICPDEVASLLAAPVVSVATARNLTETNAFDENSPVLIPLREHLIAQHPQHKHPTRIGIIGYRLSGTEKIVSLLSLSLNQKQPTETLDLSHESEAQSLTNVEQAARDKATFIICHLPAFQSALFSHQLLAAMQGVVVVVDLARSNRRQLRTAAGQLALISAPKLVLVIE